jgi:hypothetical protein
MFKAPKTNFWQFPRIVAFGVDVSETIGMVEINDAVFEIRRYLWDVYGEIIDNSSAKDQSYSTVNQITLNSNWEA